MTVGIIASLVAQERRGHFGVRGEHAVRVYGLLDGMGSA